MIFVLLPKLGLHQHIGNYGKVVILASYQKISKFYFSIKISQKIENFPSNIAVRKAGYKTQSKNISENPENGILNFNLRKVPTCILRVKSVGSEIYVNGYRVKSGDRVPVAANTKIEVRVVNPLKG